MKEKKNPILDTYIYSRMVAKPAYTSWVTPGLPFL